MEPPSVARVDPKTPIFLLGKTIRLLPNENGGLSAADLDLPTHPAAVKCYLAKAFGDHQAGVRLAMEVLAARYTPLEINRIGFRLYEKFRPEIPCGGENRGAKAELELEKILSAAYVA